LRWDDLIDEKMLEKARAFVRVRNVKEMFEITSIYFT